MGPENSRGIYMETSPELESEEQTAGATSGLFKSVPDLSPSPEVEDKLSAVAKSGFIELGKTAGDLMEELMELREQEMARPSAKIDVDVAEDIEFELANLKAFYDQIHATYYRNFVVPQVGSELIDNMLDLQDTLTSFQQKLALSKAFCFAIRRDAGLIEDRSGEGFGVPESVTRLKAAEEYKKGQA